MAFTRNYAGKLWYLFHFCKTKGIKVTIAREVSQKQKRLNVTLMLTCYLTLATFLQKKSSCQVNSRVIQLVMIRVKLPVSVDELFKCTRMNLMLTRPVCMLTEKMVKQLVYLVNIVIIRVWM